MSTEVKPLELLKTAVPELKAILALNAKEGVDVETIALQELEHLRMAAITKPDILDCLPATVVMAVKAVLKQNLTLDPYAGLVYIKTRNVKIKNAQGQDEWKKALEIQPSCNGLLSINYQCGKIIDHKNPEVKKDDAGKVIEVSFEYQVASGRWEKRTFDESDFTRWQLASHKENGRNKQDAKIETMNYANPNYTNWKGGIDPEFARAKAIRHSLKKLGTNPNEGKFNKIIVSAKTVIIDKEKEEQALIVDEETGEITNAIVISETKNEPATGTTDGM